MNLTELKKASKAIDLPIGSKKDMVDALIKRFAPDRKRKRDPAAAPEVVPAEALSNSDGEDGRGSGGEGSPAGLEGGGH